MTKTTHRVVISADDAARHIALFELVKGGIVATESPDKPIDQLRFYDAVRPPLSAKAIAAAVQRAKLSERELDALRGMSDGLSNSEIGARIGVTEDTIKTYVRRLYRKIGARDRANAVLLGYRRGLLGGES